MLPKLPLFPLFSLATHVQQTKNLSENRQPKSSDELNPKLSKDLSTVTHVSSFSLKQDEPSSTPHLSSASDTGDLSVRIDRASALDNQATPERPVKSKPAAARILFSSNPVTEALPEISLPEPTSIFSDHVTILPQDVEGLTHSKERQTRPTFTPAPLKAALSEIFLPDPASVFSDHVTISHHDAEGLTHSEAHQTRPVFTPAPLKAALSEIFLPDPASVFSDHVTVSAQDVEGFTHPADTLPQPRPAFTPAPLKAALSETSLPDPTSIFSDHVTISDQDVKDFIHSADTQPHPTFTPTPMKVALSETSLPDPTSIFSDHVTISDQDAEGLVQSSHVSASPTPKPSSPISHPVDERDAALTALTTELRKRDERDISHLLNGFERSFVTMFDNALASIENQFTSFSSLLHPGNSQETTPTETPRAVTPNLSMQKPEETLKAPTPDLSVHNTQDPQTVLTVVAPISTSTSTPSLIQEAISQPTVIKSTSDVLSESSIGLPPLPTSLEKESRVMTPNPPQTPPSASPTSVLPTSMLRSKPQTLIIPTVIPTAERSLTLSDELKDLQTSTITPLKQAIARIKETFTQKLSTYGKLIEANSYFQVIHEHMKRFTDAVLLSSSGHLSSSEPLKLSTQASYTLTPSISTIENSIIPFSVAIPDALGTSYTSSPPYQFTSLGSSGPRFARYPFFRSSVNTYLTVGEAANIFQKNADTVRSQMQLWLNTMQERIRTTLSPLPHKIEARPAKISTTKTPKKRRAPQKASH